MLPVVSVKSLKVVAVDPSIVTAVLGLLGSIITAPAAGLKIPLFVNPVPVNVILWLPLASKVCEASMIIVLALVLEPRLSVVAPDPADI